VSLWTEDCDLSIKVTFSCGHFLLQIADFLFPLLAHFATALDTCLYPEQVGHFQSRVIHQSLGSIDMDPQTIPPPLPMEVIYWASSSEDSTQKVKFCDVHPEFPWIISAEKNTINVWDFVR
jgi:hypothetical protein